MIRSDYKAYGLSPFRLLTGLFLLHTFWLVALYRAANWLHRHSVPFLPGVLRAIGVVLYSADLSPAATIGPGFRIAHSVGIVVGAQTTAGANLELFQNTTLGGRDRNLDGYMMPMLGDNVTVFAGAQVLGPVVIGSNVSIGANAVVISDVPSSVSVAGVPARVIGVVEKSHSLRSMRNDGD